MYVSFWVRAGCSIDALSPPTFISRFYFPALSHFLNEFDVSTVFFFFFFFLVWEKVFREFEKKKWPSQDRVWERQKKAIGAFIRLFIFPLLLPCDRKTRLCLPNGYSITRFVAFDQSSLKHNSEDDLPKKKLRASLSVCIYIYQNCFPPSCDIE